MGSTFNSTDMTSMMIAAWNLRCIVCTYSPSSSSIKLLWIQVLHVLKLYVCKTSNLLYLKSIIPWSFFPPSTLKPNNRNWRGQFSYFPSLTVPRSPFPSNPSSPSNIFSCSHCPTLLWSIQYTFWCIHQVRRTALEYSILTSHGVWVV